MIDIDNEIERMEQTITATCAKHFTNNATTGVQIYTKSLGSYNESFTAVDLSISQDLLECARTTLPESYSEEELATRECTAPFLWQFDPLDGTNEFIQGHLDYCGVSAALLNRLEDGTYKSIAGILYLPMAKVLITGNRLRSCISIKQDGKRMPAPNFDSSSVIGYVRAINPSDKANKYYEKLGKTLEIAGRSVPCGGAVHAFISLILGRINVLCLNFDHSKEWDTSAAQPIIDVLGGFLCDLDGKDFTYNRKDHFNRRGFLSSIAFSKEKLLPHNVESLLERRLVGSQS